MDTEDLQIEKKIVNKIEYDSKPILAFAAERDINGKRIDKTYATIAMLDSYSAVIYYSDILNRPTKLSEFTNDLEFITSETLSELRNSISAVGFSGSYTDLLNKPSIPTKTSDLTNDSDFITENILSEKMAELADSITTVTQNIDDIVEQFDQAKNDISDSIDELGQTVTKNKTDLLASISNTEDNINSKLDKNVVVDLELKTLSNDNLSFEISKKNLKEDSNSTATINFPLVNQTTAGLMSYTDYNSLQEALSRLTALEGRGIRLLYTDSSEPTKTQIEEFVINAGYTEDQWSGISVVISESGHIWHYYANSDWKDDGLDTIELFGENRPGVLIGVADSKDNIGKIFAETDGTGAVIGFNDLYTKTQTLESEINTLNDRKAFSSINIGNSSIEATTSQDSFQIIGGTNISTSIEDKTITISSDILNATTTTSGLMSKDDKTKLNGIDPGAEVNVQSDWGELNTQSDAYIKNKPSNLVQDESYVHTDNNFTDEEKSKLEGIDEGAQANVQSDWTETDSQSDTYIKNKPSNLVTDDSYVHTDNNFTDEEKSKLEGIEEGAQVNPSFYLKDASVTNNKLTIIKNNDSEIEFTGGQLPVLINVELSQLVDGFVVPTLTSQNIVDAYTAFITGIPCRIINAEVNKTGTILFAKLISQNEKLIRIGYEDIEVAYTLNTSLQENPIAISVFKQGGATVVANPTLDGTESNLNGIQIEGTKYKIPQAVTSVNGQTGDVSITLSSLGLTSSGVSQYKQIELDNTKVQVESAVKDGDGNSISNTYLKKSELTVDQTYNASSSNPQSGIAVKQAVDAEASARTGDITTLRNRIIQAENNISSLQSTTSGHTTNITSLTSTTSALSEKVSNIITHGLCYTEDE